jgi:2,4-dienoyl-CoA reductase-like NADH-dependent reductase (Old Yellow Enzyme family)
MSILFTPLKIGNLEIKNRFVHSGTYECMADEQGFVTDKLIKRYKTLSRGEVALIIPGYLNVHPLGKATPHQTCIDRDDKIPGLKKLVDTVHDGGAKICLQLVHAGRQTRKQYTGAKPMAPSSVGRDPMYLVKPQEMTETDINSAIDAYSEAARRAVEAGTDAIHISAGGGYLPNQFLSPYLNQRQDKWGGTDENRFRFVKKIVTRVKDKMPDGMPLFMKLNAVDYTPKEGVTPALAKTYAGWLSGIGVDAIEITTGTTLYSNMHMWRGEVPVKEFILPLPKWQKPLAWLVLNGMVGKFDFEEMWNLEYVKYIKPVLGKTKLCLVGGNRRVEKMEEVIEGGYVDLIFMCRPFIREPLIVKQIKEGKTKKAACLSCNKCVGALANDMPLRCYADGLPKSNK